MIKPLQNVVSNTRLKPFEKLPIIKGQNEVLGEVFTETRRQIKNPHNITIFLKNKLNEVLGTEYLSLNEDSLNMFGLSIQVIPMLRQKNLGLGEILRLASIILILENEIKKFEIYSKAEAIYFHSKYKFEPMIKQFTERDNALKEVIKNCQNEFESYRIQAENLLKKCSLDESPEYQRELCIETNKLLKEYIQEVLKTKDKFKSHPFERGFQMVLNINEILNNKEYFNSLLKKHKIDYQI